MKIAIPVETEEGLDSARAAHFGQAPFFVIAQLEDGKLVGGGLYDNVSHDEFGCAGIAEYVRSAFEADVVIVRNISHDAFAWLAAHDVEVHQELEEHTASGALRQYLWGQTHAIDASQCQDDGHHH